MGCPGSVHAQVAENRKQELCPFFSTLKVSSWQEVVRGSQLVTWVQVCLSCCPAVCLDK